MHKASIILPCYNGSRWIHRSIESILAQTYRNFELIIVDDGSIDNSKEKINLYLSDPRVHYIYQRNSGFSAALNRGLKESKGEVIGFIGQDDLWAPKKLEIQSTYLNSHQNVGVLYSNYYLMNSEEQIISIMKAKAPASSRIQNVKNLFLNNFIGFETVLVKRECFEKVGYFDESMSGFSDYDLWLRIAGQFDIGYVDKTLVKKRSHNLQLSIDSRELMLRDEFLITKKALAMHPYLAEDCQKKCAMLYYSLGVMFLKRNDILAAKRNLLKTIRFQPRNLKAVFFYLVPNIHGKISKFYLHLIPVQARKGWLET